MEFKLKAKSASDSQGNMESRNEELLKSVSDLEFEQSAIAFITIVVHTISQVRDSLGLTDLHYLRDQGVGRSLFLLTRFRKELKNGGDITPVNDLCQSDQFILGVCTDEIAAAEKSGLVFLYLFESFAESGRNFYPVVWANPGSVRRYLE